MKARSSHQQSVISHQLSVILSQSPVVGKQGWALALLLTFTLAACTSPVDPVDDGQEIISEPIAKSYVVKMDFKRIEILGDCDADNLGIENKGEFSYRVSYALQEPDGSWTAKRLVKETPLYGHGLEAEYEKKTDQGVFTIDETIVQQVADGMKYRMYVSAIEWDTPLMDSRMNGKTATEEDVAGGSTRTYHHKLDLGSSTQCKVRLFVNVTEEEVPGY